MARKLMNAVQYDSYGGGVAGLKHVEIPVPAPKKAEILLKLEAASLNPVDWKIQEGLMPPNLIPRKLPFIPASDIAGEVVEVGTGVTKFKAGDKVVSYLGFPGSYGGEQSYAQVASSPPPYFCGSPPSRVSNPLIQMIALGMKGSRPSRHGRFLFPPGCRRPLPHPPKRCMCSGKFWEQPGSEN